MATTAATPAAPLNPTAPLSATAPPTGRVQDGDASPSSRPGDARGRLGRITVLSLGIGGLSAALFTLLGVMGGGEAAVTGGGLLGFSVGWMLLVVLSSRRTARPQRWAAVPATVMAAAGTGLLVIRPDDAALTTAGWVWAPVMLALSVWSAVQARRTLTSSARSWVVMPALALLALVSIGGGYQTVRVTLDATAYPMPGRSVDVGDHALHLDCTGTGSPTVVLESGLGGASTLWSRIVGQVSATTRVCAYDHAGQGWSESADSPRDGLAVAADLGTLLDRAGETGPFVLVGHSVGGPYAMTFAAERPAQVAGLVLLDETDPHHVDASVAGKGGGASGPMALLPSLARMGLAQPFPASTWSDLPAPAADAFRAYSATARAMTNAVDEVSEYPASFSQAQALTTLGARPLVVLTLVEKAEEDGDDYSAQQRFARLSTNSSLRTGDTTHTGLVDDEHGSALSVVAIRDVVQAVRTGSAVAQR